MHSGDDVSSEFFTPSAIANNRCSKIDESPSPAYSKRASQLFQFLIKKKRNSGAGDLRRSSSGYLTVDETVRSDFEEQYDTAEEELGLLDAFPGPPSQYTVVSNRESYRLFHLPGRPKKRERTYDALSPVSEADYPPTPKDSINTNNSDGDSSLPPDIQPVRLVHRKPPSYDLYSDESIPSYMKPELASISTVAFSGGSGSQGTRKALASLTPGLCPNFVNYSAERSCE